MYTVRQLMQDRDDTFAWSVTPESTVGDALQLMAEKNVGAVVIVEKGQMVGIFSERDFARKAIQIGKCSLDTQISEAMTREMVTIPAEQSLEECLTVMTRHHIRHLPVMEGGRLVGMVSMRDAMEAIISGKDTTIEKLEGYILGKDYGQ
jgi:CBS domain-containing protein